MSMPSSVPSATKTVPSSAHIGPCPKMLDPALGSAAASVSPPLRRSRTTTRLSEDPRWRMRSSFAPSGEKTAPRTTAPVEASDGGEIAVRSPVAMFSRNRVSGMARLAASRSRINPVSPVALIARIIGRPNLGSEPINRRGFFPSRPTVQIPFPGSSGAVCTTE